jgi:hypothetical protein
MGNQAEDSFFVAAGDGCYEVDSDSSGVHLVTTPGQSGSPTRARDSQIDAAIAAV